ncbi:F-box domain, Skp2-like protein [Metarhizium guizhouense ARSEF 977]|uniref:F-box domain, Skp2-like protein n=1 Tax=Metarhizium guizhouense (strain ARSEF 977) TaxID=1276136 RepID=A0A0B4HUK1_METGA|nr:F-box domain, Skp2-like protein [Metarhizium guizhouense ARSEF 977]
MAAQNIERSLSGTLPPEIRQRICASLPRPDLKNLRLVSRVWDEAPLPALLRTVFLRVNLQSFENLQDIAESKKLGNHVRFISYDGRTLGVDTARYGFEHWMEHSACRDFGMLGRTKIEFLEQFTLEQLEEYYQNYQQYLFEQQHMLRRGYEKNMLLDALKKLPKLLGVEYVVPKLREMTKYDEPAPPLKSFSAVAQKILAEPESYHGYRESEGHFWTLLQSTCLSGHAKQLERVRASNIDLKRWNDMAASFIDCYESLISLQHLSLEFAFAQHSDDEVAHLARMIGNATSMTSVRLSFDSFSFDEPLAVIHLPQVIGDDVYFKHLRSLSLQALATPEAHLRSILKRHCESLHSLELSNMEFKKNAVKDEHGRGSWVLFIEFLNREMSVDHVKFNGTFSNSWNEGWVARSDSNRTKSAFDGSRSQYSNDCLLYRIEQFVTGGGTYANPFTTRSLEDDYDYSYGHNLPWKFEADESWYFEGRLLL